LLKSCAHTAGELSDRIEFLRLVKLALGFAGRGNVVENQRSAADGAGSIMQWPAVHHEVSRIATAGRTHADFQPVELFTAQGARSQPLVGW